MIQRVTVYLHSSKESMVSRGEDLGLSERALSMFEFTCYEMEVGIDVDMDTLAPRRT
jgi:hypothetical protein